MIEEHNIWGLVEPGLKNWKYIAVRAGNSANIVDHYTGNRPKAVYNPVMLYDFSTQLEPEIIEEFKKKHSEKYYIVYSY